MAYTLAAYAMAAMAALAVASNHVEAAAADDSKVRVELYSEALCPYCANFIVNYLSTFFYNGLLDIVELSLVPYGNARIDSSGKLTCQHGPDECKLNIIQACAIKMWPQVTDWFPFIYCLESLPRRAAAAEWKTCKSLNVTRIEECYESPLGYQFEMEFAKVTSELEPPQAYVPWVVVDGQPLYEDYMNVVQYVCRAYKGPKPLPQVCSSQAFIM